MCLHRRVGEIIVIGDPVREDAIVVVPVEIPSLKRVVLGFDSPNGIGIWRLEVAEKIARERNEHLHSRILKLKNLRGAK